VAGFVAELERPLDDALARRFSREARPANAAQESLHPLVYNTQINDTAGRPLKQLYMAAIHKFQVLTKCQGLSRLSDFDAQKLSTEA
jgi:hypothetical protein